MLKKLTLVLCVVLMSEWAFGFTPDEQLNSKIIDISQEAENGGNAILQRIPEILAVGNDDRICILQNLIYVIFEAKPPAATSYTYIGAIGVHKFMNFTPEEMLLALLELYDSENEKLLEFLDGYLEEFFDSVEKNSPNITNSHTAALEMALEENRGEISARFLAAMIQKDPVAIARALLNSNYLDDSKRNAFKNQLLDINSATKLKNWIRTKEHVRRAQNAIKPLIISEIWWVRLFALEICIEDSQLAIGAKIESLHNDVYEEIVDRLSQFVPYSSGDIVNTEEYFSILKKTKPGSSEFRDAFMKYTYEFDENKYYQLLEISKHSNGRFLLNGLGMVLSFDNEEEFIEITKDFVSTMQFEILDAESSKFDTKDCISALGRLINVGPGRHRSESKLSIYPEVLDILSGFAINENIEDKSQVFLELGAICEVDANAASDILPLLLQIQSELKSDTLTLSFPESARPQEAMTRAENKLKEN